MSSQNNIYRSQIKDTSGNEIFEIHPVILGGSPTDVANKKVLTREEHIKIVKYWNKIIDDLRKVNSTRQP
jgi:uncharacterized protein YvpB